MFLMPASVQAIYILPKCHVECHRCVCAVYVVARCAMRVDQMRTGSFFRSTVCRLLSVLNELELHVM